MMIIFYIGLQLFVKKMRKVPSTARLCAVSFQLLMLGLQLRPAIIVVLHVHVWLCSLKIEGLKFYKIAMFSANVRFKFNTVCSVRVYDVIFFALQLLLTHLKHSHIGWYPVSHSQMYSVSGYKVARKETRQVPISHTKEDKKKTGKKQFRGD